MPTEKDNATSSYALRIAMNDQRIQATRQLFISACLGADEELMERLRLEMHSLLDVLLDDTYLAMTEIRRKMGS